MATGRPRGAALSHAASVVVLVAALAGCSQEPDRSPAPARAVTPPADSRVDARPSAPAWTGRMPLRLRVGTEVLTPLTCEPDAAALQQVCSADGDTFATYGEPRDVVLVAAEALLGGGHLSWSVVLRFAPGSGAGLHAVTSAARSGDGRLLLGKPAGPVLLELPVPALSGRTLRLDDLDKPAAWGMVEDLVGGR